MKKLQAHSQVYFSREKVPGRQFVSNLFSTKEENEMIWNEMENVATRRRDEMNEVSKFVYNT